MKSIGFDEALPWNSVREGIARIVCGAAIASAIGLAALPSSAAETDWSKVAAVLGKSGTEMPGGVYRVGLPRTDLHVTLDGVELKPGFALGSWLAFRVDANTTMVMGDLVLTEPEITPVMTKLSEEGIGFAPTPH
jgi:hypothetical protein